MILRVQTRLGCIVAMLLLSTSAASRNAVPESLILGDWCAGSTSAFHEELSLTIEDGKRLFSSWLHQRPAESGTWALGGRTLRLRASSGAEYVYTVERATSKRLVLREADGESEVYVRSGCRSFDAPPVE